MSGYPPGGEYDERLLASVPAASRAERQEGYNVNLLDSEPQNSSPTTRKPPSNLGHANGTEAVHSSKEALPRPYEPAKYDSKPKPWYRQGKWRIAMLIGAVVVIGAVVGGAVGGTVGHNKNNTNTSTGPSTASIPEPTTVKGPSVTGSPQTSSSVGGGAPTSGGGAGQSGTLPSQTTVLPVGAASGVPGARVSGNNISPAFAPAALR